ncbi:MAG: putative ABC transport system permease protein [Gammaproteobacteria bacterium]
MHRISGGRSVFLGRALDFVNSAHSLGQPASDYRARDVANTEVFMMSSVQPLSAFALSLTFVPMLFVITFVQLWNKGASSTLYAVARMLIQLMLVGYFLVYLFDTNSSFVVVSVLAVMLAVSSSIAIRPLARRNRSLYLRALAAIGLGGCIVLVLVTQFVLRLDPWYAPQYMIPMAGMIFANTMNSVSLAAERFEAELCNGADYVVARNAAFRAALIPMTNALLAVGVVSLPGMMTGQILSGVSPLVAAQYQIMVMAMTFGASGIAAVTFLLLARRAKPQAPGVPVRATWPGPG